MICRKEIAAVSARITTPGDYLFRWRGVKTENNVKFKVSLSDDQSLPLTINDNTSGKGWVTEKLTVVASESAPVTITFENNNTSPMEGGWVAVDFVEEPITHPEPTDADKATISAVSVKDGKFTLSFTSDERFDYNLLTNANLLIDSWGKVEKKGGTGETLTFEPEIIDGLPQLFYKVETIQRQD